MLMSAGIEPPAQWAVGGWLLVGGEKMSKTSGNVVNPLDLVADFGVDGFRYYVLAETPYGNDGDFTYEGLIARYNSDLANNLGNLLARVATVVGKKCGGIGPAPAADSPLAAVAAAAVEATLRRVGGGPAEPRPRRDVVADPRHQRVPRGERAVEGRARPGGRRGDGRRARGAAHRRRARLAGHARRPARRVGAARPQRPRRRPALPAVGRWGGYPGGVTVTKGDPLFPRKR